MVGHDTASSVDTGDGATDTDTADTDVVVEPDACDSVELPPAGPSPVASTCTEVGPVDLDLRIETEITYEGDDAAAIGTPIAIRLPGDVTPSIIAQACHAEETNHYDVAAWDPVSGALRWAVLGVQNDVNAVAAARSAEGDDAWIGVAALGQRALTVLDVVAGTESHTGDAPAAYAPAVADADGDGLPEFFSRTSARRRAQFSWQPASSATLWAAPWSSTM